MKASMRVYLFRHGHAGQRDSSRWPNDDLRPLSTRGVERTREAAEGLARFERETAVIWSSPLTRAIQTARILGESLDQPASLDETDALAPGMPPDAVTGRLAKLREVEAVFLVGHEPGLGELAGYLLFGRGDAPLPLKKAGACALVFEGPVKAGSARLKAFLPPRVLRRIAEGQRV